MKVFLMIAGFIWVYRRIYAVVYHDLYGSAECGGWYDEAAAPEETSSPEAEWERCCPMEIPLYKRQENSLFFT